MSGRGRMVPGGLFLRRPRSVTIGLGIAAAMAGIGLLVGLGMLLGYGSIYVGLNSFFDLPMSEHNRIQGLVVLAENLVFLMAIGRALRPAQIPRYLTIGICGVTGVFLAVAARGVSVTSLAAFTPALLLMLPSASEYYGD